MPESLHLVTELAIIMIAAGIFTVISKALKQPAILGYIIAGFLVGPHLGLFPQFGTESIKEWSELGIIFLLFGLGLEFSFKKLLKVGSSALIMAGVICVGMFCVGMLVGHMMGWTSMECIFLGGMTGMSSTTIIIKAFGDMGLKEKPYASLIFGALVFEDLIAVLLMVLLSTLAMTGKFSGGEMLMGLAKLVFFLILWFLVGLYIIPSLLKRSRQYLNDEIVLLVGLGLCFLMVVLANLAGFSSALGAFVMGSILAETLEGQKIEKVTRNIKDMFGAIFFVSVGMMVDPAVIAQQWLPIIIIAITAIVGILLFSTTGALLAGQGLDNAVHAGFSLAQLGEFAFIIAGLGCSLGVLRDFIYPVVITVSVITTFTTPFLIKLGDPVASWLDRTLPVKVLSFLNPKKQEGRKSKAEQNEWGKLLKKYFLRLALYGVVLVAVITACAMYLDDILTHFLPGLSPEVMNWTDLGITLALMAPFVFGIVVSGQAVRTSADILLSKNPANRWPLTALISLRAVLATMAVIYVIASHFTLVWWAVILLVVLGTCIFVLFARNAASKISHLESTFMENLNTKEEMERRAAPVASKVRESMADFDVNIYSQTISQDFAFIGRTLREMPFRKTSGINIIKIVRGSHSIVIPSGSEIIYPGDVLLAVGTPAQLAAFRETIRENTVSETNENSGDFTVEPVEVSPGSIMAGHTLRELDIRKNGCMIVSLMDRNGILHTNPSADQKIEEGDMVWIAGQKASVEWYR